MEKQIFKTVQRTAAKIIRETEATQPADRQVLGAYDWGSSAEDGRPILSALNKTQSDSWDCLCLRG